MPKQPSRPRDESRIRRRDGSVTAAPRYSSSTYLGVGDRAEAGAVLDGTVPTPQNAAAALRVVVIERPSPEAAARWARALTLLLDAGA